MNYVSSEKESNETKYSMDITEKEKKQPFPSVI
jgi:hypothetical protein